MDVYGYGPWQYTCSDDISNAQQQGLGGSGVPFTGREMHEGHQMPVPSGSPWTMQQMPWGMSDPQRQLVQFTAQTNPLDHLNKTKHLLHCKRKPENIEPPIPTKQLITEEKMAAHLNNLHLSSDYTTHSLCPEKMKELPSTSSHMMSTDCEQLKGKFLVLSEELRNLKTEPLIPPTLLERLEKPCMSLVLWKPEQSISGLTTDDENEDEEKTPKRKGLLVDYGTMDVEM